MNKAQNSVKIPTLFGTDGIRTKVGQHPLTPQALPLLGRALACWAYEKYGDKASFLIAKDTRYSCDWIKSDLAAGLLSKPVKLIDVGILPTPALFHLINQNPDYTCAIMISASHNPADDNGIKLVDGTLGKLTPQDEQRISELFANPAPIDAYKPGVEAVSTTAQEEYKQKIISLFPAHFLKGQTVVIDCANGATSFIAPDVFRTLGAHVTIINNAPDGYNINKHCGALDLDGLITEVAKQKALIGLAFDGDGDRIMAVNRQGVIKDGDDIVAFLLEHPDYKNEPAVVSTIMANQGCETYIKAVGKDFIRTAVGDKYVVEALKGQGLNLGGEPSGHIVLHNIVSTGDGILVALKILETMLITGNTELKTFTKFPQILINVPIKKHEDLSQGPVADIIAASKRRLHAGRLLVRYSGTEDLVRVMVEDEDRELTQTVAQSLAKELSVMLS